MKHRDASAAAQRQLSRLVATLGELEDEHLAEVFTPGKVADLLSAIAPARGRTRIYQYLLEHKHGLQVLAGLRLTIRENYCFDGAVQGKPCVVSPHVAQWFNDGVMFLQGAKPFEGLIGLYQNGQVSFAVAARDIQPGEEVGPDDFFFLTPDDPRRAAAVPFTAEVLDDAIEKLQAMLLRRETKERLYQEYLAQFPWAFGAQYKAVQRHEALDDCNIPDFTAVRARDGARDMIEVKQPFMPLFRSGGGFRAEFSNAWDQTERYLDFVRRRGDYLRNEKGLHFANPRCYLLLGYHLTPKQRASLAAKERMNPAITVITYDDLLAMVGNTVEFIRSLSRQDA